MGTGWVQVFILTIAECVAPAGKSVCQESQFELEFLTQQDCEVALEQLLALKTESEKVIVDQQRSGCAPSAQQTDIFTDLAEVNAALGDQAGWRAPETAGAEPGKSTRNHEERLATLKSRSAPT